MGERGVRGGAGGAPVSTASLRRGVLAGNQADASGAPCAATRITGCPAAPGGGLCLTPPMPCVPRVERWKSAAGGAGTLGTGFEPVRRLHRWGASPGRRHGLAPPADPGVTQHSGAGAGSGPAGDPPVCWLRRGQLAGQGAARTHLSAARRRASLLILARTALSRAADGGRAQRRRRARWRAAKACGDDSHEPGAAHGTERRDAPRWGGGSQGPKLRGTRTALSAGLRLRRTWPCPLCHRCRHPSHSSSKQVHALLPRKARRDPEMVSVSPA